MHKATPWAADWFGKFLGAGKLPEWYPHAEASPALAADARSTVPGETDPKTSGCHLMHQVMLGVGAVVVARRGTKIFVLAQHESCWKTSLAQAQGRAHDLSRAAAKQPPVGVLTFLESLCLMALLFKNGMICVKPTTVVNRILLVLLILLVPPLVPLWSRSRRFPGRTGVPSWSRSPCPLR